MYDSSLDVISKPAINPLRGKRRNITHWTVAEIPWQKIDRALVRDDAMMFYLVVAASFIETAADLYTSNLVKHFTDPQAQYWLHHHWQPEELQHGLALRTYVETVWPEYNWTAGYANFYAEYSKLCTVEELESSRALEMVARCVVETGTSSFYAALQHGCAEPVLKKLAGLIRQDEVSHYNHFRHFFESYNQEERIGRFGVMRSLYKRFTEVEDEDVYLGLKYAWLMRFPDEPFTNEQFTALTCQLRRLMVGHYPYRTAIKMIMKPLSINPSLLKIALPLLEHAARRLMFRLD